VASSIERLTLLKKEIAEAKLESAIIQGALQQNLQRLKDEFQCRSLDAAKIKLGKMREQKETLQKQIDVAVAELEENYQW
jgi:hypothetical protein